MTLAEEIPRLSKVPGYNLSCIFSESIKFFYYSQAMNIWNYYPDVHKGISWKVNMTFTNAMPQII